MLDGNNQIAKTEHRVLFALALISFGLRIVELVIAIIFAKPQTGTSFHLYYIFDMVGVMSPIYSFFVFAFVTMLLWRLVTTRILIAAFFLALLAWFSNGWFLESQRMIAFAKSVQSEAGLIDYNPVLVGGTYYDVFTLFAVDVLMIWIAFIAVRMFLAFRKIP